MICLRSTTDVGRHDQFNRIPKTLPIIARAMPVFPERGIEMVCPAGAFRCAILPGPFAKPAGL